MRYYKYIFCVVVYRNYKDLVELINSINTVVKEENKIIVVNNYYDEISEKKIKQISLEYNCDFISSENKGYGSGNNKAIQYALYNYNFEYIVISNPDIILQKFDLNISLDSPGVIAPCIINGKGKKQNPMYIFNIPIINKLIYFGIKQEKKMYLIIGVGINRIIRNIGLCIYKICKNKKHKIYVAHGSFLLIDKKIVDDLTPLYDENMFLFGEEGYLAWKLKENAVDTWYCDGIVVKHKENGSMKFRSDINEYLIESNLYVYEKYYDLS